MHVFTRAWRHALAAVALVAFALPVAAPLATPASAQSTALAGSSAAGIAAVTPALAFNPIGFSHTVTFTCSAAGLTGTGATTGLLPGCYNLTASVTDITTGSASSFTSAQCGSHAADVTTATVNCSTYQSPLPPAATCAGYPAGFALTTVGGAAFCGLALTSLLVPVGSTATAVCTALGGTPTAVPSDGAVNTCLAPTTKSNVASFTINSGAPHPYLFTFTFYTPRTAAGGCLAGGTAVPGPFTLSASTAANPFVAPVVVAEGVCKYTLNAEKKYVELTGLQLTTVGTNPCTAGQGPSTVLYSEGLKAFFGKPCLVTAIALGTIVLKTGINCSNGTEPANGSPAPAMYGAGALYSCVGDTLSVVNIPSTILQNPSIPITFTVNGPLGAQAGVVTFNGACAGTAGAVPVGAVTGANFTFCPSGFGSGTIAATFNGYPGGTINSQPIPLQSNILSFTFRAPPTGRIVPYVRWSGEKAVLTKCFGGGGTFGGAAVEFTLNSTGAPQNASLIPATTPVSTGGTGTTTTASSDTVWTVADASGCASVIVLARGEGIVQVDAAIFGTAGGAFGTGAPLLNEHAFTVYYLKLDHVDLENLTFPGNALATLSPSLAFTTGFPGGFPTAAVASFNLPNPPGTGQVAGPAPYSVQLCAIDYVRAMVHGYFEIPGDPSARTAAPQAPTSGTFYPGGGTGGTGTGANTGFVLPAGRWVLPEDWPVLATFAGYNGTSPIQNTPGAIQDPSSIFSWDLNSGWVFNPGGENAVLCAGPYTYNAATTTSNAAPGPQSGSALVTGAITAVSTGPCFGKDAAGTIYSTANNTGIGGACGGITVGIGPFDQTQACTNPFPLTYTPSGAGVLGNAGNNFSYNILGPNSTYLPNGTLNQWDAPMPPAQVSFGITNGGPGVLGQVSKTNLYSINTGGNTVFPNPFYSEAIPASPLIPPITNNGGYMWNSWGFSGGTTVGLSPAPGFIPGETTTGGPFGATTCPPGFTLFGAATCLSVDTNFHAVDCAPLGGNLENTTVSGGVTFGQCAIHAPNPTFATAGGLNTTNFGNCGSWANSQLPVLSDRVTVQNATGFLPGMTVSVYSATTGTTLAGGLVVDHVVGNTIYFVANANLSAVGCVLGGTAVFVSQQYGQPIPAGTAGSFTVGAGVGLFNGTTSTSASSTVAAADALAPNAGALLTGVDAAGNTLIYLNGAEAIARALGNCLLSRGPLGGPVAFGTCEPSTFGGTGVLITTAPAGTSVPVTSAPANPYPFWQWVPNPNTGGCPAGFTATGANCTRAIATVPFTAADCAAAGGTVSGGVCFVTTVCPVGFTLFGGTCSRPLVAAADIYSSAMCTAAGGSVVNGACSIASAALPRTATVYSDNHGEAVVALQTGVQSQVAPVNGTCPAGYTAVPTAAAPSNCVLNFETLGSAAAPGFGPFSNVATALATFSAAKPGCLDTTPAGSQAVSTGANATVGASGPQPLQICVNSLGRIEFGPGATLGSTTVQAVADYPYIRGDHPAIGSATLTKVWTSQFAKTVTVAAAGTAATTGVCAVAAPGVAGANAPAGTGVCNYTVTITAFDVCGNAINGEPVQVFAVGNAGAVVLAPMFGGQPLSTGSATVVLGSGGAAAGTATLALEVLSSALGNNGLILKVVFQAEGIERFVTVVPPTAATTTVPVTYLPGYNMVGGPPNSNFGSAEAVFAYTGGTPPYSDVTASAGHLSSAAPTCTGYFAYFASATTVNLPATSHPGDTAACTLNAGWNLVGNPFASPASIPTGTTAYWWNPQTSAYQTVGQIPVGGAVFVFNSTSVASTLTLTAT